MNQGLKDRIDHTEVAFLILELALQVNEIRCDAVQSLGKESRELIGDVRL
jgi:hypothetical protein